jgi:hypothetical protein
MQQIVLVLGVHRDGRRHSPWAKGLLHPANRKLRFRKRQGSSTEGFKDTWERAWREDHAEIDRMAWLQAMLEDCVLRDVCFNVDIPVPEGAGYPEASGHGREKVRRALRIEGASGPAIEHVRLAGSLPIPAGMSRGKTADRRPVRQTGLIVQPRCGQSSARRLPRQWSAGSMGVICIRINTPTTIRMTASTRYPQY